MDLNLKIDYASPMMLVLVCLGVMLAMNAILPMLLHYQFLTIYVMDLIQLK